MLAGFLYKSVVGTVSDGYHKEFRSDVEPMVARNLEVFNKITQLKELDAPWRAEKRWTTRQAEISYNLRSNGMGWNWMIFGSEAERGELLKTINRNNLALVPHNRYDQGFYMQITPMHGCLHVPVSESNEAIIQGVEKLLAEFQDRLKGMNAQGLYSLEGSKVR